MSVNPKAFLAMLPLVTACGIAPGDYDVYRIASAEVVQDASCFPSGIDPNDSQDTSTFRTGDTFAIFTAGDGTLFLDSSDFLLEGTKSGGAMSFSGTEVDVEFFGASDASFTTNTQSVTITIDGGSAVSGTAVQGVDQTCNGSDCQEFDTFACSGASSFVGIRVNGVDLEHQL